MHEIVVDGRSSQVRLMDLSTSFLKPENEAHYPEWAGRMLREANGVVLLYDVTSTESFEYITRQAYNFLWGCRRLGKDMDGVNTHERRSFGCVLAGNKLDLVTAKQAARAVSQSVAEEWAYTQGFRNLEFDSLASCGPERVLKLLLKSLRNLEQMGLMDGKTEAQQTGRTETKEKGSSLLNTIKDALKSIASR